MLVTTQHERVALIRLNRPERRNALGTEMVDQLDTTLNQIEKDQDVCCVVLTGEKPGFCAGSDLKELAGLDINCVAAHEKHTAAVSRRLSSFPKPVIAAVDGFAIGGGFLLATATDLIVTSRNARWHLPEVKLGWIPPWGLPALVRRVGLTKAKLLAWGAEPIDGDEAGRIGLADVVTDKNVLDLALSIATRLAELPPDAVRATKLFFNNNSGHGDDESLDELATTLFENHCRTDTAIATFNRFGGNTRSTT